MRSLDDGWSVLTPRLQAPTVATFPSNLGTCRRSCCINPRTILLPTLPSILPIPTSPQHHRQKLPIAPVLLRCYPQCHRPATIRSSRASICLTISKQKCVSRRTRCSKAVLLVKSTCQVFCHSTKMSASPKIKPSIPFSPFPRWFVCTGNRTCFMSSSSLALFQRTHLQFVQQSSAWRHWGDRVVS